MYFKEIYLFYVAYTQNMQQTRAVLSILWHLYAHYEYANWDSHMVSSCSSTRYKRTIETVL